MMALISLSSKGASFPALVETLGKAVLMTGSSRGLSGAVRETLLSVIENLLQLRSDNETIEERAEGGA